MNPLYEMRVVEVEPGHVVADLASGESLTVDDGQAVLRGDTIYVTPKDYAAIRARTPQEDGQ